MKCFLCYKIETITKRKYIKESFYMEFSWEKVLERISEVVTPASFITWFKPTNAKVHEHTITVIAANSFGEDWLRHHYGDLILKTVQDLYGGNYDIVFTSPSSHSDT